MGYTNGHRIIKAPDENGIITIDLDTDGIRTPGSEQQANTVLLLVDGSEVKGVRFTLTDGAEDHEPSSETDITWLVFRPRTTPVIVRHMSGDVPAAQRVWVQGTPGEVDSWLIKADHIASFCWNEAEGMFLLTLNLWTEYVAP